MSETQEKLGDAKLSNPSEIERFVVDLFLGMGFSLDSRTVFGGRAADLGMLRNGRSYLLQIKYSSESRKDRLIPLWSQAMLQAARAVADNPKFVPVALVVAPRVSHTVADNLLDFASDVAPEAVAGVLDLNGFRKFRGHGFEDFNSPEGEAKSALSPVSNQSAGVIRIPHLNLFSDLNQWLAKVLFAIDIPESMITAPRGRYRNPAELGVAAGVAKMTATRFVNQLKREGFLDEHAPFLRIVRRDVFLSRWQAATAIAPVEVRVKLLFQGDRAGAISEMANSATNGTHACRALFSAADALGLGFVKGAENHLLVPAIGPETFARWGFLVPARPGESYDFVIRQCAFPQSVFRAAVSVDGVLASDVIQTWLDVSHHPTRGREQADFIRERALSGLMNS